LLHEASHWKGKWTAHASELDHASLKDYLEQCRAKTKTEDWVIDLLDVAYVGECGPETEDLSSLNLVKIIGIAVNEPFQIFGDSDEAWRIAGGSSKLIEALVDALKDKIRGNAASTDEKSALAAFHDGLAKISPKMAKSLDPKAVTSFFWSDYPYTLGSYSAAKVGQFTTMLDEAGKPALNGRLQFAGEHTSGADYFGYMNGGVRSGNTAAKALLNIMALQTVIGCRPYLLAPIGAVRNNTWRSIIAVM
jgi:Flavin containing amine oxidoreductase